MRLPEWCQTHSFKEFLELIEDQPKESTMNEEITAPGTEAELVTAAPLTDAELEALLAKPVIVGDAEEVSEDEATIH